MANPEVSRNAAVSASYDQIVVGTSKQVSTLEFPSLSSPKMYYSSTFDAYSNLEEDYNSRQKSGSSTTTPSSGSGYSVNLPTDEFFDIPQDSEMYIQQQMNPAGPEQLQRDIEFLTFLRQCNNNNNPFDPGLFCHYNNNCSGGSSEVFPGEMQFCMDAEAKERANFPTNYTEGYHRGGTNSKLNRRLKLNCKLGVTDLMEDPSCRSILRKTKFAQYAVKRRIRNNLQKVYKHWKCKSKTEDSSLKKYIEDLTSMSLHDDEDGDDAEDVEELQPETEIMGQYLEKNHQEFIVMPFQCDLDTGCQYTSCSKSPGRLSKPTHPLRRVVACPPDRMRNLTSKDPEDLNCNPCCGNCNKPSPAECVCAFPHYSKMTPARRIQMGEDPCRLGKLWRKRCDVCSENECKVPCGQPARCNCIPEMRKIAPSQPWVDYVKDSCCPKEPCCDTNHVKVAPPPPPPRAVGRKRTPPPRVPRRKKERAPTPPPPGRPAKIPPGPKSPRQDPPRSPHRPNLPIKAPPRHRPNIPTKQTLPPEVPPLSDLTNLPPSSMIQPPRVISPSPSFTLVSRPPRSLDSPEPSRTSIPPVVPPKREYPSIPSVLLDPCGEVLRCSESQAQVEEDDSRSLCSEQESSCFPAEPFFPRQSRWLQNGSPLPPAADPSGQSSLYNGVVGKALPPSMTISFGNKWTSATTADRPYMDADGASAAPVPRWISSSNNPSTSAYKLHESTSAVGGRSKATTRIFPSKLKRRLRPYPKSQQPLLNSSSVPVSGSPSFGSGFPPPYSQNPNPYGSFGMLPTPAAAGVSYSSSENPYGQNPAFGQSYLMPCMTSNGVACYVCCCPPQQQSNQRENDFGAAKWVAERLRKSRCRPRSPRIIEVTVRKNKPCSEGCCWPAPCPKNAPTC